MSCTADLDAQLIWQVSARGDDVLTRLHAGLPVAPALSALLGYLRAVVLTRIAEQDSRIVAGARGDHRVVDELRDEHLSLREDVEDLAQALGDGTGVRTDDLDVVVPRLVERLDRHLRAEAVALVGRPTEPGHGLAWADAVRWYPAVEGAVIDMDNAVCTEALDAVLGRLLRLGSGEHVELRGHGATERLRQRLLSRGTERYSWCRVAGDGTAWAVRVERRDQG